MKRQWKFLHVHRIQYICFDFLKFLDLTLFTSKHLNGQVSGIAELNYAALITRDTSINTAGFTGTRNTT